MSIADMNQASGILLSKLCTFILDLLAIVLITLKVCVNMMHRFKICASNLKSVRNIPPVVRYWEHCTHTHTESTNLSETFVSMVTR